jgi:hypothetical protein
VLRTISVLLPIRWAAGTDLPGVEQPGGPGPQRGDVADFRCTHLGRRRHVHRRAMRLEEISDLGAELIELGIAVQLHRSVFASVTSSQ